MTLKRFALAWVTSISDWTVEAAYRAVLLSSEIGLSVRCTRRLYTALQRLPFSP